MNLYKRMALGAIAFGVIGPVIVAICFTTLAAAVVAGSEYRGLGDLVGGWLSMIVVVSVLAFYGGWIPATIVGALVGVMATRLRRRYLYPAAILGAPIVVILFFEFFDAGDTAKIFGGVFSIPATAVLSPLVLEIIHRYQKRNLQGEHMPGERL